MACTPLIHRSSVQIPLRFGSGISRTRSSFSSSTHFAYSSIRQAALSSTSDGGRICCFIRSYRMQCIKDTSQENFKLAAAEEVQITGRESCEEDSNIKNAASDTSLGHQNGIINQQSSVRIVISCVLAAITFGIALALKDGPEKASEYFAGYILEQSLSVDNLFVFVLIFNYFKVPIECQSRVLSYGIAGAIIFRAIIILLGAATIQLFSAKEEDTDLADNFIVRTCQKFIPVTAHYDGDRFITIEDGVWKATPLLLTVAVIELSDIAFAVDSIPAVFGVTRDPFIVFSSNLFAISGLRSIYTLISGSMSELEYLQPAIGIVLGFIGTKMIFDFFGYRITTEISLGFVATTIGSAVLLSLHKKSKSELGN